MTPRGKKILADEARCVTCLTCALRCSFHKLAVFNPATGFPVPGKPPKN